MDVAEAAWRWRDVWEAAWPRRDVAAVAALYAPACQYRALVFREPRLGVEGVRAYLDENYTAETEIRCRFGEPVVGEQRAAVEWWASWVEEGRTLTMAGTTLLRFDADGKVVDHRDYWNESEGRVDPFPGW